MAVAAEAAEGEDWKSPPAAAAVAAVAERSPSAEHKLRADKPFNECTVLQWVQYPAVARILTQHAEALQIVIGGGIDIMH